MPRASQSRESGIVNYFKTADLAVALIVLSLAKDAVAERKAKSTEARERALKGSAPKPKTTPVAQAAGPAAPKKRRKKRKAKVTPAAQIEGAGTGSVYDENDLNS